MSETTRTQVAIVGAGPAGLMIAQMLANRGVESVAIDIRSREEIENTHRAGILEAQAIQMLDDENVSDRYRTDGYEHDGTIIRVNGVSHRINFKELVGASVWLYPQTDVFIDLANARQKAGADVRFGVSDVEILDPYSDTPGVKFVDADGNAQEIRADFLVGSDGSRSICRFLIPEEGRTQFFREYPFAWFGIMCEAPMSADELIYATNERGFALISQRTESIQRMYLQCNPSDDMYQWSEDQLWEEFQSRMEGADGFQLKTGKIFERTLLPFRSFVQEPMQHGRIVLAGDAAHTVPPTGARGLNLALSDARALGERLAAAAKGNDPSKLDGYQETALKRIWRAQNFSYWMTTMMHSLPDENPYDYKRRQGELEMVLGHKSGQTHLAEAYSGWPNEANGL